MMGYQMLTENHIVYFIDFFLQHFFKPHHPMFECIHLFLLTNVTFFLIAIHFLTKATLLKKK